MTAIVTEVLIEKGFVKARLAESIHLVLNEERGFLNASELCKQADKHLFRYNELKRKQKLELVLKKYSTEISSEVDRNSSQNPSIVGTYFHPALLLDLALWLSPEVYAHSAIIISQIFHRSDRRQSKLAELFRCGEIATYEYACIEPPVWHIRYIDFEFTVNEQGCFDSSAFCSDNGKKLSNFEKRTNVAPLLQYLCGQDQLHQSYYNPLLFLSLVAWVDVDWYVKCARVVFCCSDERLGSQFRKEIVAAGFSPPSEIESVVEPNRSPTESGGSPVEFSLPSTSSGQRCLNRLNDMNLTFIDADSDVAMDMIDEADHTLIQAQLKMAFAEERRKHLEEIEVERAEKAAALAELERVKNEKRLQEERAKREKRLQDEELECVRREFQKLTVTCEKYRERLRRSPHQETTVNVAAPNTLNVEDVSVAKHQCLVLFELTNGVVYGCRGQLRNATRTILKHLRNITAFVGWFLTDDAVETFRVTKQLLKEEAEKLKRKVRITANQVRLYEDESDTKFDVARFLHNTLLEGFDNIITADVRILGRRYDKPVVRFDDYVAATDPKTVALLERVYKWIENQSA